MELSYSDKKQEKILTDQRLLKKYYSNHHNNIANRLSELRTANNLAEIPNVPPPRRHKLTDEKSRRNCWGIDYSRNYRIIIQPIGDYDIDDLKSITRILIISLEDYH